MIHTQTITEQWISVNDLGQCVLTLVEDEAIALRDALTELLG
jgi:hypothetical protein